MQRGFPGGGRQGPGTPGGAGEGGVSARLGGSVMAAGLCEAEATLLLAISFPLFYRIWANGIHLFIW